MSAHQAAGVGLAHDYLLTMRGAERTFGAIADCWPDAPIYTTIYDPKDMGWRFAGHNVQTSYLQYLHVRQKGFRRLLPLFPSAVERLSVGDHDLIVSSSSAFAHGIRAGAGTVHICYCHSPFRYAWHEYERALKEVSPRLRPVMRTLLDRIRKWDIAASKRVSHYIANSRITQRRIADNYRRDSVVIHPPVDVSRFGPPQEPEDYFLFVGEVVGHKRPEIAIEAVHRAGGKIKVVGDGPERERLTSQYGTTVEFLGRTTDEQLNGLYARTKALLVPNIEEFGIAAVEVQAAGRPVVAIAEGGTLETVDDGVTGLLVQRGTVAEFAEVLSATDFTRFDAERITAHAAQFSTDRFRRQISEFVASQTGRSAKGA